MVAPALGALPGIAHGYFTREGGVSTGVYDSLNIGLGSSDDRANVIENRGRVADRLGVARGRFVMPYQVHSPDVVVVEEPWAPGESPRADALVTNRPGLGIGVSTADCGPILFADGGAGVVGAAHAGWKGAFTGVAEATLAAMERLGAERSRIVAVLGPTISGRAYEVGPEFVDRFLAADAGNARYFAPSNKAGHSMFDLPAYIVSRLRDAGVGHAEDLGLCTYADEARFFSFRRMTHRGEPDYGRLVSAIAVTG
ncbi:peptidoglycan editing factor PgeF [Prosthecomicrobium sp. N25]|uniref:peptidoglycan editing factor PgeF n=1 Tax=Prosthecomicrobium sp. N25 TaxID=3129254 RepID=UPI003FCCF30D